VISQAQRGVNNASNNAPSMPGELLVQLKAGITGEQKGKALGRVSATAKQFSITLQLKSIRYN